MVMLCTGSATAALSAAALASLTLCLRLFVMASPGLAAALRLRASALTATLSAALAHL